MEEKKLDSLLKIYKNLFLIRSAEEEMAKYYIDNKIFSIVHFYVGQEAIAAGVCDNLKHDDKVLGNHRSHGHYLAKGGSLKGMIAEMLGKKTGCCSGKGGSMHMIDKSVNFMGSTPILGSVTGLASGLALSEKFNKTDNIVVCFLGDGASEEGIVYESLNFSSLFNLPLLIIVENNSYSINSVIKDRRSTNYDVKTIVNGLGANYFKADGNDYFSVFNTTKLAIESIKENNLPVVLECFVYRHMSHSSPLFDDKDKISWYRSEDDNFHNRVENCPLVKIENQIIDLGGKNEINQIKSEVLDYIKSTIRECELDVDPDKKDLYEDVYER
jgi:pyruvate dehydrogenase E1 component alpha subunit